MVCRWRKSIVCSGASLLVWGGLASLASAAEAPFAEGAFAEGAIDLEVAVPAVAEEIPEEILRTEIITGARSPLTGEPMTAADYAQLQAALNAPQGTALVSEDIRYLIFLLQVRRAVRPILPFIR